MSRILVFGGTGMLGRRIAEELRKYNYDVVSAARFNADVCVDLSDETSLVDLLLKIEPRIIINSAAVVSLDKCDESPLAAWCINAKPVSLMANYANAAGCKLIQVSTDHYYTGDGRRKHNEQDGVCLVNDYARSKYAAECFARCVSGSLILRTNVTGIQGHSSAPFARWLFESIENRSKLTLFDDFYTSTIDVGAFSRILIDLIKMNCCGIYNLASRDVASKKEFAEAVAKYNGWHLDHADVGSVFSLGTKRAESLGLDVSSITAILGYEMPSLDDVVNALSQEYRNEI